MSYIFRCKKHIRILDTNGSSNYKKRGDWGVGYVWRMVETMQFDAGILNNHFIYFLKDSKACLVSLYWPGAGAVSLGDMNLFVVEPKGLVSDPSAWTATGRSNVDLILYDPGPGTFFLSAFRGISSWYLGI